MKMEFRHIHFHHLPSLTPSVPLWWWDFCSRSVYIARKHQCQPNLGRLTRVSLCLCVILMDNAPDKEKSSCLSK